VTHQWRIERGWMERVAPDSSSKGVVAFPKGAVKGKTDV